MEFFNASSASLKNMIMDLVIIDVKSHNNFIKIFIKYDQKKLNRFMQVNIKIILFGS